MRSGISASSMKPLFSTTSRARENSSYALVRFIKNGSRQRTPNAMKCKPTYSRLWKQDKSRWKSQLEKKSDTIKECPSLKVAQIKSYSRPRSEVKRRKHRLIIYVVPVWNWRWSLGGWRRSKPAISTRPWTTRASNTARVAWPVPAQHKPTLLIAFPSSPIWRRR